MTPCSKVMGNIVKTYSLYCVAWVIYDNIDSQKAKSETIKSPFRSPDVLKQQWGFVLLNL
jgi:hypothetical protein